jgi:hypothetical protein
LSKERPLRTAAPRRRGARLSCVVSGEGGAKRAPGRVHGPSAFVPAACAHRSHGRLDRRLQWWRRLARVDLADPDAAVGRTDAVALHRSAVNGDENHGSVVYLTATQHYVLYGLMFTGAAFLLLEGVLYYSTRERLYVERSPDVALPGEAVVWTGAAPTGIRLRLSDAMRLPFLIVWCGGAIYCETRFVHGGAPWWRSMVCHVIRVGWFPAVRRYSGSALDSIQYKSKANGTGTIRFVSQGPRRLTFSGGWSDLNDARLDGFEGVADAERVYRLITDAGAR